MPLGLDAMEAAQLVCVVAAAVMLAQSRTRRVRLAHLAMLVVMAGLLVADGLVAVLASAAALAVAGAALLVGRRRRGDASCALDLAACAGLVVLMGLSTLGRAGGHHAHHVAASAGAGADQRWLAVALAGAVVLAWAVARSRLDDHPRGWPTSAPAWTMVAAMSAMAVM